MPENDLDFDVAAVRAQFPALARNEGGRPVAYFDGPAGSQVPRRVIDAVAGYLGSHNANTGGAFTTSRATDEILAEARRAFADFMGAEEPDGIVFGNNATTLLLALSRAIARTWRPGDEVVVTQLDHDANVTPWLLAARDAGISVRTVCVRTEDTTLDPDDFAAALGARTRLVAVTAASNATGTMPPVADIVRMAHAVGAEVVVDAVHYAPHRAIDVAAWGCDYAVCSAYKFFGPHVGALWGRPDSLARLPVYQVRAAGDDLPWRWMIGTLNHEGIAGASEAVEYLADLGRRGARAPAISAAVPTAGHASTAETRRTALVLAYERIAHHERGLCRRLLAGLAELPALRVWGISDPSRMAERAPTISFTHAQLAPAEIAARLAARGVYVWHGHYFALDLSVVLGREPDGMVRVGILHYNTADEVDRLLSLLAEL